MNDEQRFNKYVRRTKKCWLWIGTPKSRYGRFRINGKHDYAHRVAYLMWVGGLEEGSVVHHTCGNSKCVRPTHLQAITPENNTAEMVERQSYLRAIRRLETEVIRLRKRLEDNT